MCSCACLEVSFKLKHERQDISINCMPSGGSGAAAPLRTDFGEQAEKKKGEEKSREDDAALWSSGKKNEA